MISQLRDNLWPTTTGHKGLSLSNFQDERSNCSMSTELGNQLEKRSQKFLCFSPWEEVWKENLQPKVRMTTAVKWHPNILGDKTDCENIFLTFSYRAGYSKKRMRNKHVFQHPLLSPLHKEKELISIKGVHLIFWQDINSTVLLVLEIIDHNICIPSCKFMTEFPTISCYKWTVPKEYSMKYSSLEMLFSLGWRDNLRW